MCAGVSEQRLRQDLPGLDGETEVSKKLGLAGRFGMFGSQKVIDDFGSVDMSVGGIRKIHSAPDFTVRASNAMRVSGIPLTGRFSAPDSRMTSCTPMPD